MTLKGKSGRYKEIRAQGPSSFRKDPLRSLTCPVCSTDTRETYLALGFLPVRLLPLVGSYHSAWVLQPAYFLKPPLAGFKMVSVLQGQGHRPLIFLTYSHFVCIFQTPWRVFVWLSMNVNLIKMMCRMQVQAPVSRSQSTKLLKIHTFFIRSIMMVFL